MNLIQQITQVFSRYKEKAATSHYVPPNSLITLTYGQLEERVRELAQFLLKQGMQPGDLVMCYMTKSLELVVSILAVMLNGGVCSSFYSILQSNHNFFWESVTQKLQRAGRISVCSAVMKKKNISFPYI